VSSLLDRALNFDQDSVLITYQSYYYWCYGNRCKDGADWVVVVFWLFLFFWARHGCYPRVWKATHSISLTIHK